MSAPVVVSVAADSPAARAGILPGDEVHRLNGETPRDLIEWKFLADEPELQLDVARQGQDLDVLVSKAPGEPLGAEVSSAVFDRVRTCDNHCEFCFIYQLPKGMRKSLYLKDDDYRLSFLYGNFTTLTRFTEADLERIVTERLSPLNVSIHATDPDVRARMLRNPRGAMSLRWLRALLDHGIEIRGQVVVCPGVNDGAVLDDTLAGILDQYPELASVAIVPLGVSRFNPEDAMRPHTTEEARSTVELVHDWQDLFTSMLGHPMAYLADEYYLLAGERFPTAGHYGDFSMYEDGIGMAVAFQQEFTARGGKETFAPLESPNDATTRCDTGVGGGDAAPAASTPTPGHVGRRNDGFFQAVDVPANPAAYTGLRHSSPATPVSLGIRRDAPIGVLTGTLGARVITPLIEGFGRDDVRVIPVANEFFGGNTGVTGLMVGADVARILRDEPTGHRYLLPDVCLSDDGRFLDGVTVDDLPRHVVVVPTDGRALRETLEGAR